MRKPDQALPWASSPGETLEPVIPPSSRQVALILGPAIDRAYIKLFGAVSFANFQAAVGDKPDLQQVFDACIETKATLNVIGAALRAAVEAEYSNDIPDHA